MILSVVTMKGGSGKSTVAMCLAGHWHSVGRKVALIDADPAATLLRWRDTGTDFRDVPCAPGKAEDISDIAASLTKDGHDRILIDTPGFRSAVLERAVTCSDMIVIPIRPSPIDFQVAADTADLVAEIMTAGQPKVVRFMLTQTNKASVIARHMRAELQLAGYALLDGQLSSRVVFGEAALAGTTPTFVQPLGAASNEIAQLAREIDGLINPITFAEGSKS